MSQQVVVVTNVLTNPSFEVDAAGWSGGISRANFTAGRAHAGTYYGSMGAGNLTESAKFPAAGGQPWTASAYFSRGSTTKTASVQPVFYDATGTELSVTAPTLLTITAANVPERFSTTRIAPAGTTQVALRATSNGAITFDAMQLVQTDTLGDYFDGSTLLEGRVFAWTGTPHASSSTETITTTIPDPPAGTVLKVYENGAWVERTAPAKARVNGAWVDAVPQRWDAAANAWTAL